MAELISVIVATYNREDALSRMDRYSTASAEVIVAAGRKVSFMTGIGHGLYSFLRTYVLRAGFLDGAEGFLLAVANAEGSYYRYMKAWLATRERKRVTLLRAEALPFVKFDAGALFPRDVDGRVRAAAIDDDALVAEG